MMIHRSSLRPGRSTSPASSAAATSKAAAASHLLRVLLLVVTAASSFASVAAAAGGCDDLDCLQDAPCVEGDADYSDHPKNYDGTEFDFHSETSVAGAHCACPHGWTGVTCDTKFETCDGSHKCYNGGKCVPGLADKYGNEQLYCDCSNAADPGTGKPYAGKYCEQLADEESGGAVYCSDDDDDYCLNGGECNQEYPRFGDPCLCPPGYEGPKCQYVTGTVPDCPLECQNGGVCTFDLTPKQKQEKEEFMFRYWEKGDDPNDPDPVHARCDCPDEGFVGELCEIPTIPCGAHYCYYGGTCLERVVDDSKVYHCDCTTSYTDKDSYAGRYCEYPATSFCTKDGGLNGHLFCVNDGQCKDDPYEGCDCMEPYTGFSCEFVQDELTNGSIGNNVVVENGYDGDQVGGYDGNVDNNVVVENGYDGDQDGGYEDDYSRGGDGNWIGTSIYNPPEVMKCDLKCDNGGVCRTGLKQTGFLEDLSHNAPHLNEQDENFMHCVCPDGFYGVYCEEEVDVCGNDEHYCLHGSTCIPPGEDDGEGHRCNCADTNSELADVFAGDSCEHPVNDICTVDTAVDTTPLSFCVNGGSCKRKVQAGEAHPGCNCEAGWKGPHCELREATSLSAGYGSGSDGPPTFQIIVFVVSLVAISAVTIFSVMAYVRRRQARRTAQISESVNWSSSGYRDEPDDGPNLAPRRSSMYDDAYPSSNAHSSSTDPMATHLAPANATAAAPETDLAPAGEEQPLSEEGEESAPKPPEVYIGPPRDEDGHELHSVQII